MCRPAGRARGRRPRSRGRGAPGCEAIGAARLGGKYLWARRGVSDGEGCNIGGPRGVDPSVGGPDRAVPAPRTGDSGRVVANVRSLYSDRTLGIEKHTKNQVA